MGLEDLRRQQLERSTTQVDKGRSLIRLRLRRSDLRTRLMTVLIGQV